MNVQFYVAKYDDATWQFLSAQGYHNQELKSRKVSIVAVEQNIKYYKEAFSGDCIYVKTSIVEDVSDKVLKFRHQMFNVLNNDLISETILTTMMIDNKTRKSIKFFRSNTKR